jgi:hypothetical protein
MSRMRKHARGKGPYLGGCRSHACRRTGEPLQGQHLPVRPDPPVALWLKAERARWVEEATRPERTLLLSPGGLNAPTAWPRWDHHRCRRLRLPAHERARRKTCGQACSAGSSPSCSSLRCCFAVSASARPRGVDMRRRSQHGDDAAVARGGQADDRSKRVHPWASRTAG